MINKIYKNKEAISKIKEVLKKEGSIQLHNFIENIEIKNIKFKKRYTPSLYSYSYNKLQNKKLIATINKFISNFYKLKSSTIYCFSYKDYTLLNDNLTEENGLKVILELTDTWNKESNGYTSFIKNNEEILRIEPIKNSLTIIKTNKQMKSFVKYINHKTKNNKRIFIEIKFIC